MTTYWGVLEKSATDAELIEAAIERICATHNYFNTVAVWGMMPKSQTDDQTILAAISVAVAAHEADPDSHLGVGESLQSHKASVIIDHEIGSVVADKNTMSEIVINIGGLTTDCFYLKAGTYGAELTNLFVYAADPSPADSYLANDLGVFSNWLDYTKNFILQATFWIQELSDCVSKVALGFYLSTDWRGVGFKVDSTGVKGFWGKAALTLYTSYLVTGDHFNPHCYRAQYDATLEKMLFFVDGVQVASMDKSSLTPIDLAPQLVIQMTANSGGEDTLRVGNIMLSRQI